MTVTRGSDVVSQLCWAWHVSHARAPGGRLLHRFSLGHDVMNNFTAEAPAQMHASDPADVEETIWADRVAEVAARPVTSAPWRWINLDRSRHRVFGSAAV